MNMEIQRKELSMHHLRLLSMTAVLVIIFLSACGGKASPETPAEFKAFDPNNFDRSTEITNKWMPMLPGTQWAYEGTAVDDEGNKFERRIEFTVTDLTKEINGVRTVVAWIVDYNDGEVIEKEIAFYAQDNDGNVWYLGEHPEEWADGKFVDAPTWLAGIEESKPGVKMMANPKVGIPNYFQGWGPAVEWSDYGHIEKMGEATCVPVDCYENVMVIAESSLGETGAAQFKYYVSNVGEVRVNWGGQDATQEALELVEHTQLSLETQAEIRAEALALEKHAYEVSADVYGKTSPME
jgi:hypothetical protein